MLLIFFLMSVMFIGYDFAPKFLNEVKGVSLEQLGWLGALNALGGFSLNLLLGRRLPRPALMLAIGMMALQVGILLQARWIGWFALSYLLRGAFSAMRSLVTALVTRLVKPSQLGTAFGISEMVTAAADVAAPIWGGWMYAAAPQYPFATMLLLSPVAILLVWRFAPRQAGAAQPAVAAWVEATPRAPTATPTAPLDE
jgi:predicted MFS family arabinose efflux permease